MRVATAGFPQAVREQRRTGLTGRTVATGTDDGVERRALDRREQRPPTARAPYAGAVTGPARPPRNRRDGRDRHGRGLRGPLLPAGLPAARSRAEQFDDLVLDAVSRLVRRFRTELADVAVVVDEVPPAGAPGGADGVELGRGEPAADGAPARIVVHRRPVESRASGLRAREDLVHDVVVDAVAELLGLPPEEVDPERADDGG